jgi:predicted DCC family thiol-disulfide oxidoreductase YuxK
MSSEPNILLFDGYCNLCNGLVKFVIKRDTRNRILFTPLTSEKGKLMLAEAGLEVNNSDTVVFFSEGKYFIKSMAILKLMKTIGGGWKIFYSFIVIPRFLRDFIYDIIARNRNRIFGKSETCLIPDSKTANRFME